MLLPISSLSEADLSSPIVLVFLLSMLNYTKSELNLTGKPQLAFWQKQKYLMSL